MNSLRIKSYCCCLSPSSLLPSTQIESAIREGQEVIIESAKKKHRNAKAGCTGCAIILKRYSKCKFGCFFCVEV